MQNKAGGKSLIPKYMILPLILAFSWNNLVYFGSRLITTGWKHTNAEIFMDHTIPFIPWTAFFYLSCYVFWVINYWIGSRQDKDVAFRFLAADFFAKTVCLFCFLVFPTTNTRPVIEGGGFWEGVMQYVYAADAADNLFPSIHCLTSWFCYIAVRKNRAIQTPYRIFSLFYALAVCISTLTTKQHVIIDMVGGIVLAEASYYLVDRFSFSRLYEKVIMAVNSKLRPVS